MCYNKDTEREVINMRYWINYEVHIWKIADEKPEPWVDNQKSDGRKYEWTEVNEKEFLNYLLKRYELAGR